MKLYAAGQDILTDAFSGNVKGAGPGSAEMTFEERGSEPLMFFMADKTEPSAYSLPLSRIFLDPFTTTGLVVVPRGDPQHPEPPGRHLQVCHQEDQLQVRHRPRLRRLHR